MRCGCWVADQLRPRLGLGLGDVRLGVVTPQRPGRRGRDGRRGHEVGGLEGHQRAGIAEGPDLPVQLVADRGHALDAVLLGLQDDPLPRRLVLLLAHLVQLLALRGELAVDLLQLTLQPLPGGLELDDRVLDLRHRGLRRGRHRDGGRLRRGRARLLGLGLHLVHLAHGGVGEPDVPRGPVVDLDLLDELRLDGLLHEDPRGVIRDSEEGTEVLLDPEALAPGTLVAGQRLLAEGGLSLQLPFHRPLHAPLVPTGVGERGVEVVEGHLGVVH